MCVESPYRPIFGGIGVTPRLAGQRGASIWSGCNVRIRLWPRLPRDCHRLRSILPTHGASVECPANWCSTMDPTPAGHISCPGSIGLGVHAGQGSLPPRAAIVAGPIWPHLVGRCGGLRLKSLVGTGLVKVTAQTTHSIEGGGGIPHAVHCRWGIRSLWRPLSTGHCRSSGTPGASGVGAGSSPVANRQRVRTPIDPFEYRTGPPIDPLMYRWRRALLHVCGDTMCFLFWGVGFSRRKKQTRPPPEPPVPAQALAIVGVGGSNDAHWGALRARDPGAATPGMERLH